MLIIKNKKMFNNKKKKKKKIIFIKNYKIILQVFIARSKT